MMKYLTLTLLLFLTLSTFGQFQPNYDESKIPAYELPELLQSEKHGKIKSVKAWETKRRPEILELFADQMYGKVPDVPYSLDFKVKQKGVSILSGKALLKEVEITISTVNGALPFTLMIITPNTAGPHPCFMTINFYGNHTLLDAKNVSLTNSWVRNNEEFNITDNKATEASRGARSYRWDIDAIVDRGYALASIYYGDLDPDYDDGFQDGLHPLFYGQGQSKPKPEEWGSIGVWAFGMSRSMDYLVTDPLIDARKVAVMGHSRLGKTSLWAGVNDQRFALVISNDSGCGGAALSRRAFGETVGRINTSFPHWFNDNFTQYNENESALPIDQHMLLALVATRALYVASAEDDRWADPKGEFLSTYHANPVYKLYGEKCIDDPQMPAVDQPKMVGKTGYHVRSGGHNVTDYDWEQYMNFADQVFE
ncbi:MAG: acetylxylan esterase [Cyclobacteriaceae bacterium]